MSFYTVGIPAYNEEHNIGALLEAVLAEPRCTEVIVADDKSNDDTAKIVYERSVNDPRVRLDVAQERGGQLSGWQRAARLATNSVVVFIDADAMPISGSLPLLADAITPGVVVASARVEPIRRRRHSAAYFSARLLDQIRASAGAIEVVIGRAFSVNRAWFIGNVTRDDMLANDAYIAATAITSLMPAKYVRHAVVTYHAPEGHSDFTAQRLRADAGLRQLVAEGFKVQRAANISIASIICSLACESPTDAALWLGEQLIALGAKAASRGGGDPRFWTAQRSTKRTF